MKCGHKVGISHEFILSFMIKNNRCTFSFNEMVYGEAISIRGIYVLNDVNDVYHIENKRLKTNESNKSYFWHCRLGHINDKRIKRLVETKVLKPFDFESYGTCESCLLGKITRQPFSGKSVGISSQSLIKY